MGYHAKLDQEGATPQLLEQRNSPQECARSGSFCQRRCSSVGENRGRGWQCVRPLRGVRGAIAYWNTGAGRGPAVLRRATSACHREHADLARLRGAATAATRRGGRNPLRDHPSRPHLPFAESLHLCQKRRRALVPLRKRADGQAQINPFTRRFSPILLE